jgi:hypothetical protein
MSSLNEQQRRKIEESRMKALEIRAAKAQQSSSKPYTITNNPGTPSAIAGQIFNKHPKVPSWLGVKSSDITSSKAPVQHETASHNVIPNSSTNSNSSLYNTGTTNIPQSSSSTKVISSSYTHGSNNNAVSKQSFTQNAENSAKQFYGSGSKKEPLCHSKFGQLNSDLRPNSLSSPSKPAFGAKSASIKGKCVLVSRERFLVDVGYCAPLIAMFKNMASKEYGK